MAAILGDLQAFDELVRRYRAAVVRTARRIVGNDHADDVAQEALLLAFKALPSIEEPARFPAWLGVITRHHALRFAKRERTRAASSVELDEVILEHLSSLASPVAPDAERDADLSRALVELPADYSTVLSLRFMDEMPLKRIAAFLGISVSTVKWRLHRGKQLLREKLLNARVESPSPNSKAAEKQLPRPGHMMPSARGRVAGNPDVDGYQNSACAKLQPGDTMIGEEPNGTRQRDIQASERTEENSQDGDAIGMDRQ